MRKKALGKSISLDEELFNLLKAGRKTVIPFIPGWQVDRKERKRRKETMSLLGKVRQGDQKAIKKLKHDRRARIFTREEINHLEGVRLAKEEA